MIRVADLLFLVGASAAVAAFALCVALVSL